MILRPLALIFDDTTPSEATINLIVLDGAEILPGMHVVEATAVWQLKLSAN